mmetsp:Transcript_30884/g.98500  ORF Transcript_30884/g.98500 Transcript_30884/m.98500 type:complete len:224 (+) Transcript_30884:747-1418(+)
MQQHDRGRRPLPQRVQHQHRPDGIGHMKPHAMPRRGLQFVHNPAPQGGRWREFVGQCGKQALPEAQEVPNLCVRAGVQRSQQPAAGVRVRAPIPEEAEEEAHLGRPARVRFRAALRNRCGRLGRVAQQQRHDVDVAKSRRLQQRGLADAVPGVGVGPVTKQRLNTEEVPSPHSLSKRALLHLLILVVLILLLIVLPVVLAHLPRMSHEPARAQRCMRGLSQWS